jgi:hypothetical protein
MHFKLQKSKEGDGEITAYRDIIRPENHKRKRARRLCTLYDEGAFLAKERSSRGGVPGLVCVVQWATV